jgi:hypothetical protein
MAKKKQRSEPPPVPLRKAPDPRRAEAAAARAERQAQAAKASRRKGLQRRLGVIALVLALLAAVGVFFTLRQQRSADLREALTVGTCTTDSQADPTRPSGQNHVAGPTYRVNPPSAGDHLVSNAGSGVYAGDDVPEDGLLVHSLEHGYVIYWHRPDIAAADKAALEKLEDDSPGDIIVAERATLPVPVAATAWGKRLLCQDVEPQALKRFASEYVGKGPEDVPRG